MATAPVTGLQIVPVAPAISTAPELAVQLTGVFPASFSLSGPRAILDQRDIPCCVSCAFVTALESGNANWDALGPLFHYFVTRMERMHVSPSQLVDLTLEDAIGAIEDSGICLNRLHSFPMTSDGTAASPSGEARKDATNRRVQPIGIFPRISRFELLSDSNRQIAWKKAMLAGKQVIAGIELPNGYAKEMTRAPWPAVRLGATHAVAILGYRDSEQAFIVQDSRGPDWFLGGQWWMPFAFVESGFVIKAYASRLQ